jgi:hypothetical protein
MWYIVLADLVVAAHVGYVSFVVLGQIAILLGWAFNWSWVRNRWFRGAHLLAMSIVAFETIIELRCPLTSLENYLRELGGQQGEDVDFVGKMLQSLIFIELPDTHWFFKVLYFGFLALVLLSLLLLPPRWRGPAARGTAWPRQTAACPPTPAPPEPASGLPATDRPAPQGDPTGAW